MNCECEVCITFEKVLGYYECSLLHRLVVCRNAKLSSIKKLLMKIDPDVRDSKDNTPLHLAAFYGADAHIVKELISAGATVHALNYVGSTPFHFAVGKGHRKTMEILLQYIACVNFPDNIGEIALHYAVDIYNKRDLWIVKKLIEVGSDVNFRNKFAETPLLLAVKAGDLDIVKELLISGADANICDLSFTFPLHMAVISREPNKQIILELIKHGSFINCTNENLKTPLYLAVQEHCYGSKYNIQTAKILVKYATFGQCKEAISLEVKHIKAHLSLYKYRRRCSREVNRLKSVQITDNISLCDFVLRGINCSVFSQDELIHRGSIYVLRDLVARRHFPIYYKIIRSHFPLLYLREILMNVKIYANNRYKEAVVLVSDVVSIITGYLHFDDMIQLLKAFTTLEGIDIFLTFKDNEMF